MSMANYHIFGNYYCNTWQTIRHHFCTFQKIAILIRSFLASSLLSCSKSCILSQIKEGKHNRCRKMYGKKLDKNDSEMCVKKRNLLPRASFLFWRKSEEIEWEKNDFPQNTKISSGKQISFFTHISESFFVNFFPHVTLHLTCFPS